MHQLGRAIFELAACIAVALLLLLVATIVGNLIGPGMVARE